MRLFYTLHWKGIGGEITRRVHLVLLFVLLSSITLFAQAPAGYYDGANGKTGAELKAALHNIIDDHTEFSYDQVWEKLRYTDEDPNNTNNVILLYTGWSYPKSNNGGGVSQWNREHTWAKSHGNFGENKPAGTDLHHLRPTDVTVNSARGNLDFDNGGTIYIDGDGPTLCKKDADSWEPWDEVKGDIARIIFYMDVRYEGGDGEPQLQVVDAVNTEPNTSTLYGEHGKLSTLLQWHQQDPVSDWERRRNNRIFELQGNRNPFIDHPEYVNLIWGNGTVTPSFTSTPITNAQAGEVYTYNINVTGNTGATFTITATTKPAWLTFNQTGNTTATITGTPTEDNVGDNSVVLNVTDGTSSKTQSFTIKVTSSIVPLQFTSTPVTSVQVDATYTYNVTLTGNSGSTFTISATTKPNWLTISSTGNGTATLTGTPTSSDIGANAVVLTGGDGNSTVEQSFSINVTEVTSGDWVGETFENMPTSVSNYANRTWVGDNNITWSATNARTDLTINNRAICFEKAGTPTLQSQSIAGGCSKIRFTHKNPYTTTGGVITIYINDNSIGTITPSGTVQTSEFSVSNVNNSFVIKLTTNGAAQIAIDDIQWQQSSSSPNQPPTITGESRNPANPTSADNVGVSATVTDPEGRLSTVQLQWGTASNALSNTLSMTNSSSTYSATIPTQTTGTVVYYRIKATDQEGNFSESTIQNYTVSPATGIVDNHQNKVTVYPNPFGEVLNVNVDGSGLTKVTVMDIIGKVVYTAEFADKTYPINTSNLKTGIYILKVLNGNKTNVIRVVKR